MALGNRTIDFRLEGNRLIVSSPTIDTGVALTGATTTAFVATTPSLILFNNDIGGVIATGAETGQKVITVDQLLLVVVGAGTALTGLEYAWILDSGNRYSSGGSEVTASIINTDGRASNGTTIARAFAGALTATAAVAPRLIGHGFLRSQIPVAKDQYLFDFGSEGTALNGTNATTPVLQSVRVPMAVVGPNQSMLLYLWGAAMTAAPTFEYQLSWIED